MGNEISLLSGALAPILGILTHVLDYFVTDDGLTESGNTLAGSITDIARGIAELSGQLHILLH
jgi:hypothetical protein